MTRRYKIDVNDRVRTVRPIGTSIGYPSRYGKVVGAGSDFVDVRFDDGPVVHYDEDDLDNIERIPRGRRTR